MNITIPSLTIDNWQHVGTVAKLRIFALQTFKSAENVLVIGASSPARDWYLELVCTIGTRVDGAGQTIRTLTIPAIQLPSTIDSDTPDARYYALFADDSGRVLQPFYGFEYFSLPASSPYTWQQIRAYNSLATVTPDNWQTQVQSLINASLPGAATTTTAGVVKLSTPPSGDSVVVAVTDPRMQPATPSQNGLMSATDKKIFDGFVHEQNVLALTWTIVHGLGRIITDVAVQDTAGTYIDGVIIYSDQNQLIVQFSAPFSGIAYIGRG